jgi:hypothetical protein
VGVRRYGEGGQRQWCRVNALVLAREKRRQNEVLLEDEAETSSSSWLHKKEKHDTVRQNGDVGRRRGATETEEWKGRRRR